MRPASHMPLAEMMIAPPRDPVDRLALLDALDEAEVRDRGTARLVQRDVLERRRRTRVNTSVARYGERRVEEDRRRAGSRRSRSSRRGRAAAPGCARPRRPGSAGCRRRASASLISWLQRGAALLDACSPRGRGRHRCSRRRCSRSPPGASGSGWKTFSSGPRSPENSSCSGAPAAVARPRPRSRPSPGCGRRSSSAPGRPGPARTSARSPAAPSARGRPRHRRGCRSARPSRPAALAVAAVEPLDLALLDVAAVGQHERQQIDRSARSRGSARGSRACSSLGSSPLWSMWAWVSSRKSIAAGSNGNGR